MCFYFLLIEAALFPISKKARSIHFLIPGTGVNVILHGKRDFADEIKLRILGWGDCLGWFGWLSVVTRVLVSERGKWECQSQELGGQKQRLEWSDCRLWRWRGQWAKQRGPLTVLLSFRFSLVLTYRHCTAPILVLFLSHGPLWQCVM